MKRSSKIMQKKDFHDGVIDDVTGWPQIQPYLFLYEFNKDIFHDN